MKKMMTYEERFALYKTWWTILDELPEGWKFDDRTGSPLNGYKFASDGESVLKGGKRALVKFFKPTHEIIETEPKKIEITAPAIETKKSEQIIDDVYVKTVNDLARKKFKQRLLNDIMVDLMVCELEGWNKREYIEELRELLNGILLPKGKTK